MEKYGRQWIQYAQVNKAGSYFRRMFIDAQSVQSVQAGQPLPDGTLIALETWSDEKHQSTVFLRQKKNGKWLNGSFSPTQPDYSVGRDISCTFCHRGARDTDYTFTRPLIEKALRASRPQIIECDKGPLGACAPEVYQGN